MRWLTLDDIKAQLRIESSFTDEDNLLTAYGNNAEEMVLNITERTEAELKAMNRLDVTKMPRPIVQATLMLVDLSYQQRNPISMANLYAVPYSFDFLIKPYMKLT